jgi:hypothetical protein
MKVGDIVSHVEICSREGRMLQHGMNFHVSQDHSVILMSRRKGAPYEDQVSKDGRILIYEGHDIPRKRGLGDPKLVDQPRFTLNGKLTPNGKFAKAVEDFENGAIPPERVRVYEKIKDGIWTYNGVFLLIGANWIKRGTRKIFKFHLESTDSELPETVSRAEYPLEHNRMIPSDVKLEVYRRDTGKCVICGATDNLHFDHDFPFSKGGTSISAKNIRLLCMRHNLAKSDRIE